ncbi:uncharacterized protein LOC110893407 [Helianthus annuus]|uniref:uncharacterized protein LOC110893407 n=1 Tax=Helianthus annuus TaxID=4232 RepID=UPI000B9082E4|nr:uncharacterized protein LOC110893407 [Helianthus annuus]
MSYADSLLGNKSLKVNFRSLVSESVHEGCDVVLPRESVRSVHDKMANTLVGYFLGDRVAYPVVDYYVRNNWKKYGIQKSMMNAKGFFFFKFADEAGMMKVMQDGPWIIRSQPMFLDIWSPSAKLEKKEVKKVQIWVKIHDVPIAAYTEDGLSMIATTIGVPKALDSYTTSMCMDMWGRSSYARALIEVSADKSLREEITMAIPDMEGDGFSKETMSVEYEWYPLRCAHCSVFGHSDDTCPFQAVRQGNARNMDMGGKQHNQGRRPGKHPVTDEEGYTGVHSKKVARQTGFPVSKPKPKFEYRPVVGKKKEEPANRASASSSRSNNPFDVLNELPTNDEEGVENLESAKQDEMPTSAKNDEDDVEVVDDFSEMHGYDMDGFLRQGTIKFDTKKGASTPSSSVTHG